MEMTSGYVATLDSKNRLTIRKAKHKYYAVQTQKNGVICLIPQKLVPAIEVSKKMLEEMDRIVANFKEGSVSEPIDLSSFKK